MSQTVDIRDSLILLYISSLHYFLELKDIKYKYVCEYVNVCVFVNLCLVVVFLAAPCSMWGLSSSVQFSTLVVSNPLQPPWTVARQASLSISNS